MKASAKKRRGVRKTMARTQRVNSEGFAAGIRCGVTALAPLELFRRSGPIDKLGQEVIVIAVSVSTLSAIRPEMISMSRNCLQDRAGVSLSPEVTVLIDTEI